MQLFPKPITVAKPPPLGQGLQHSVPHVDTPIPALVLIPCPAAENITSQEKWAGLKRFASVLRPGTKALNFGPLKLAIDGIAKFIEVYEAKAEAHEEYESLRNQLDWLFHDLADCFGESTPPAMRPSIVNLVRGIEQELLFLRKTESRNTTNRYVGALNDTDQVLGCYRRIHALLERLALNANVNIWMMVDDQATFQRLDRLSPSHAAWYNSAESEEIFRDECTPDTRLEVLERFRVWRSDSKSEKVYWLNGMAGTGKTTLAYTLCKQLEDNKSLAANFFCTRQLPSCRDAKRILPTIAYQLANFSYPFRYALSQILDQNRDVHTRRISEQFEKLLYIPLQEVQHSLPCDLVVVIDGLDECDNDRGVGEILDALFNRVSTMPIKFFLTSRPEPAIRSRMLRRKGDRDRFELHLHELDKGVIREDVKRYLQASLKHSDFALSNEHLETLTERAGVLFIYAATVARYISVDDFSRSDIRLKDVLKATTGSNGSDLATGSLYNLILKRAFGSPHLIARDRDEMRLVLETVICAQEPLTVRVMTGLLGLKGERSVDAALDSLRSVLDVQNDGSIIMLHKSFLDHMLDPTRSLTFWCNPKKHHGWLARRCLDLIRAPRNPVVGVCSLDSSTMFDQVLDDQTIEQQVSGPLFYACRYWASHVRVAERPEDIFNKLHRLESFLPIRLLLWTEVVNLTKFMRLGVEMPSQTNISECGKYTGWSMVTEAVAVAISMQQYGLALEWLEQGRSILWGQMLHVPTPYDDLYAGNLEMVKELQRVLYQPKYAGIPGLLGCPSALDGGYLRGNTWNHRLAERREELLDFLRLLPKIEDSVCPPKASKLVSLLQDGAAVIMNLDEARCDALVIRSGAQEITHVPLVGFSVQNAKGIQAKLARDPPFGHDSGGYHGRGTYDPVDYKGALAELWHKVVKPVLYKLGTIRFKPADGLGVPGGYPMSPDDPNARPSLVIGPVFSGSTDALPHITWCATGPFCSLPLHAAGDYYSFSIALPDLVISSYTPTLSLLRQRITSSPSTFSGLLAVENDAPMLGFAAISGVKVKLDQIQVQANRLPFTRLAGETACHDAVLKAMRDHSWVHFACRTSQTRLGPMECVLHLHDRDLDLDTIARNPPNNAQLAYLYSCTTDMAHSGTLDVRVPLAAGLLMAGYPAVIATIWPIKDEDAPFVARRVYECLLEGGVPDSRKAAKALHKAVTSLREKVGVGEFERWVPYVHLGA